MLMFILDMSALHDLHLVLVHSAPLQRVLCPLCGKVENRVVEVWELDGHVAHLTFMFLSQTYNVSFFLTETYIFL